MVVQKEFIERAHAIVWCSVATAGADGRTRSRILHPYWELAGGELVGWIVTKATPVKVSHLEANPYLTCTYWNPAHEVAIADCRAEWVEETPVRQRVWELYRDAPAPLGYDFWSVFPDGPAGVSPSLLKLTPYRLRLADVETLSGTKPVGRWKAS